MLKMGTFNKTNSKLCNDDKRRVDDRLIDIVEDVANKLMYASADWTKEQKSSFVIW